MQVLMIVYIAAITMIAVMTIINEIKKYKTKKMVRKAIDNCYKAVKEKAGGIND